MQFKNILLLIFKCVLQPLQIIFGIILKYKINQYKFLILLDQRFPIIQSLIEKIQKELFGNTQEQTLAQQQN
ncbi:hypothetical protein pb186bvf_003089 [Paramecium bursaria]